jgi:hypothetical protein
MMALHATTTITMDETAALEITAVRAVETADGAHTLWSDADRAWASRAAAETVGESAAPATFIARRARLALERLSERAKGFSRAVLAWRWRPWVAVAIAAGAFIAGFAIDRIGDAQRIDILAPPVLALLAWNLAVYAVLAAGLVVRYGEAASMGPLRRAVAWLGGRVRAVRGTLREGADPLRNALATFASDWTALAAPLYAARAARILHLAAAAMAAGVIVGLYARGIAFEYRATWESTFLGPATVRSIVAVAYLPGALLAGVPIPDATHFAKIHAPASENAAFWLHLMAATLAVVVIAPRLLLAIGAGIQERLRATRIPVVLADPYFQRMLRGFHGGRAHAEVLPYSFSVPADAVITLEAILTRSLGGNVALTIASPVPYGDEEATAVRASDTDPVVALFNMTATPEREAHGAFLASIARSAPARQLLVIVDESAFRARSDDPARLDERRRLWRDFCTEQRLTPVFVNLAAPDLAAAEAALDAAFADTSRRA